MGDTGSDGSVPRDAGAAALLRQARPDVRPAELRSLLAGTTDPAGGRVDVTRAITAPVAAATASLDFGPVSRAHADRRTLTYRDLTDRPVPLDLDGSSCVRVAPGTYSVIGVVYTMPSWADGTAVGAPLNISFVGHPEMKITKDTEIVFDARKAKEVKIETPDHTT